MLRCAKKRREADRQVNDRLNRNTASHPFCMGDPVYVHMYPQSLAGEGYLAASAKTKLKYFGPVTVIDRSDRQVRVRCFQPNVRLPSISDWIAVSRLKRCSPQSPLDPSSIVSFNSGTQRQYDWAAFLTEELSQDLFTFENIVGHRKVIHTSTGKLEWQFKVQWSDTSISFEPMSAFFDQPEHLVEYMQNHRLRQALKDFRAAYSQRFPQSSLPVPVRHNKPMGSDTAPPSNNVQERPRRSPRTSSSGA